MIFCRKCGERVDTLTSMDGICPGCLLKTNEPIKEYPQGWECPKCGGILAPTQPYCTFCAPEHPQWMWDAVK